MQTNLKIKKDVIFASDEYENEIPVGSLFEQCDESVKNHILCGSELLYAVKEFISEVNSGSLRPKSAVSKFERILDKYDF